VIEEEETEIDDSSAGEVHRTVLAAKAGALVAAEPSPSVLRTSSTRQRGIPSNLGFRCRATARSRNPKLNGCRHSLPHHAQW